jgi:hypothetical protein
MDRWYEIPLEGAGHLGIGKWVEIFEAYGVAEGKESIQVRSMRVAGKTLVFGKPQGVEGGQPLHPHEGEVVYIDRGPNRTRFGISLRP